MRLIKILSFCLFIIFFLLSCSKVPTSPGGGALPFEGPGWYVIDEANDSVTGVSLITFQIYRNIMPEANSAVMADIAFLPDSKIAYIAGGYTSWNSEGSHDIKAFDLSSGTVRYTYNIGLGNTIPSGGLKEEANKIYTVFYSDSGNGKFIRLSSYLGLEKTISIGGMPQGLTVKDGNIFISCINDYSYATNWVSIIPSGYSTAERFFITNKNPVSSCLSSDGNTLYLLCAGDWGLNYGSIVMITNILYPNRGIKNVYQLNDFILGKIIEINDRIFFTSSNGLYEYDPLLNNASIVALNGKNLNDIDFKDGLIYITSGWGGTECYILNFSTFEITKTLSVNGGMGALAD